jgi:plastocyanin
MIVLLLASCGSSSSLPAGTPVAPTDGALTVRAFEWGFEPASIILQRGQQVSIEFVNDGSTLHDLRISDLEATGVSSEGSGLSADEGELFVAADGGKTGTLVFTPAEAGEFDFYCTLPRHRGLGMKGTLTVE